MSWRPADPQRLPGELAAWLASTPGVVRVALDGPPCAAPDVLAESLVDPVRALGRPAVHLESRWFWRDASVRLEYGHEDVESYLAWLDVGALQREVLAPLASSGDYLPSLRDPDTDRSTHAVPVHAGPDALLIVSGQFLLGAGLGFDRSIHLAVSSAARIRRTAADEAWTLPAFDRYDSETVPAALADVVIRSDDPAHPAVRGLP